MIKYIQLILFSFTILITTQVHAETLRIASWNIANLASEPNKALRGHARSAQVYDNIREIVENLDADIVALQEIGSIPGAERALGDAYDVYFETRCLENAQKCMFDNDDIYTVIAVRKAISDKVTIEQLDELSILHDDECCTPPRLVRGSPIAVVEFNNQNIWIPSIHLKSACKRGTPNDDDLIDDCELNAEQFDILSKWIENRPSDDAVILAGDFNRLLFEAPAVVSKLGTNAALFPSENDRTCWADYSFDFGALKDEARINNPQAFDGTGLSPQIYTPKQFGAIDFFVASGLKDTKISTSDMMETDEYENFSKPGSTLTTCDGSPKPFGTKLLTFGRADPSDHCPILLELSAN